MDQYPEEGPNWSLFAPIMWTREKRTQVEIVLKAGLDVAIAVTGKTHHDAGQDYRLLLDQYPAVGPNWSLFAPIRSTRDKRT